MKTRIQGIVCATSLSCAVAACGGASLTAVDPRSEELARAGTVGDVALMERLLTNGVLAGGPLIVSMAGVDLEWTPICVIIAMDGEQPEAVAALLRHGANAGQVCGPAERTLLHEAALSGDERTIPILHAAGGNINARNRWNRTPLSTRFTQHHRWLHHLTLRRWRRSFVSSVGLNNEGRYLFHTSTTSGP